MYSEKARLSSPWKTGPQRMEFFYSMNGSTIETLSVYVKINGSEYRVWSRYGSQLSSDWIKGCVTLNYRGNYQVKTFFPSLFFLVGLFVCLFFFVCGCFFFVFCFCFVFFGGGGGGGWFIKISYLCYLSWLARAFSNSRKYIAKYSYSSSSAIYFFSSE